MRGLYYPQSSLLTIGWYDRLWWREEEPGLNCTADQRERVIRSTLTVSADGVFIDEVNGANRTTTPGIVR